MKFQYQIMIIESERGWGRHYEYETFDTPEKAQKRINEINAFNLPGPAPDWYMQAESEIKVIQVKD